MHSELDVKQVVKNLNAMIKNKKFQEYKEQLVKTLSELHANNATVGAAQN
jgi:hypothetical protein